LFNKYCDKESNATLKENATEEITQDKKRLYSDLETKAIKEEIIYVAPLNYDDIKAFNDLGPYYNYEYSAQIQTATTADMASEIVDDAKPVSIAEGGAVAEFKLTDSRGRREASIYKSPSSFPSRMGPK